MKLLSIILILLAAIQGIAAEEKIPSPSIKTTKTIFYGSYWFVPGAGVSLRERRDTEGTSLDIKMGLLYVKSDKIHLVPTIIVDYNFFYFFKASDTSSYFSWGIGASNFVPYIPLRIGTEFKYGFIDMGIKTFALPYLMFIPEVRAGIGVKF